MTLPEALSLIGNLSAPSKMPCQGYSIPASRCLAGSKFAKVEGSVCSQCYAFRGNYRFAFIQNVLEKRFQSLSNPLWVEAMALAINQTESSGFFRWHDSGDLQGVWHLEKIAAVCKLTPKIKHWLPTREFKIVGDFLRAGHKIPKNLTIRFSSIMVDGAPPIALAKKFGVGVGGVLRKGFNCPAYSQGNKCLTCRACWNKKRFEVSYKKH